MATGDIIAVAVGADGWTLDVTIEGFVPGASYDYGTPPGSAKFTCTVTSEGYTGDVLGTRQRTLYGTITDDKVYPDHAEKSETVSGSDIVVRVVLNSYIYNDDVLSRVQITAGWAVNAGAGSESSAAFDDTGPFTNNSAVDYPVVNAKWASEPLKRFGATVDCEVFAYHTHADEGDGSPVAAVKFTITDEHSHTVTYTATAMELAAQVSGRPRFPVYKCAASTATLDQDDKLTISFEAFPWIGDADAVAASGTGLTRDSRAIRAIEGLCDKNGTYPKPFAYVDSTSDIAGAFTSGAFTDRETVTQTTSTATAIVVGAQSAGAALRVCFVTGTPDDSNVWTGGTSGATFTPTATPVANGNDGAGVVSTTAATAAAAPYATVWLAYQGVKAFINTTYSRANSVNGGVIRLKDGDYKLGRDNTPTTNYDAASAGLTFEPDPNATGRARFTQRGDLGANIHLTCDNRIFNDIEFRPIAAHASNFISSSGTPGCDVFNRCTFGSGTATTTPFVSSTTKERWLLACQDDATANFGVAAKLLRNYLSNGIRTASLQTNFVLVIGVSSQGGAAVRFGSSVDLTWGPMIAFSRLSTSAGDAFSTSNNVTNLMFVGSVLERFDSTLNPLMMLANIDILAACVDHVTFVGQRTNFHNDSTPNNTQTKFFTRYNAFAYWASKHDVVGEDGTLTGGRAHHYGVGVEGCNNGQLTFPPAYGGLSYTTEDKATVGYVDDASSSGSDTGGGDYHPAPGSVLLNRVRAGRRLLPFDLEGTPYRGDGTDAAGALNNYALATVTTDTPADVDTDSATLGGNVTSDGGATVTERGVCYNTTGTPTTSDTKNANGSGTGTFSETSSGLTPGTAYYVRAYAINSVGTAYGSQQTFTTDDEDIVIGGGVSVVPSTAIGRLGIGL